MALKFRLRGLAETFIEEATCTGCGATGNDDQFFCTEHTRVTCQGIVVVIECKKCGEIYVPITQRLGVLNPSELKVAVQKDSHDTGEPILPDLQAVRMRVEKMNAMRKGDLH
jgi:uncharacterized Zn finger protein